MALLQGKGLGEDITLKGQLGHNFGQLSSEVLGTSTKGLGSTKDSGNYSPRKGSHQKVSGTHGRIYGKKLRS